MTMNNDLVIKMDHISVYRKKILVISDVSIQVRKGEFIYLIGKTGSGKTSLLKTLYLELPVEEGTVMVSDFDLTKLKAKDIPFLRRRLGIVFQDFQLLGDRSVNKNLEFVMEATGWKDKEKITRRCTQVLSMVGIPTKGFKMPHELSGGEQQRVCIARALINRPEIILADEPTGNLDPDTSDDIVSLLYQISKQGTAVIMATHNHHMINQFPGRVIRIDNGKLDISV